MDYSDLLEVSGDRTVKQFTSRAYHGAKKRAVDSGLCDEKAALVAKEAYACAKLAYEQYWA